MKPAKRRPRRPILLRCFAALTACSVLAACGGAPLNKLPPDTLSFAVFGDVPYSTDQAARLDRMIDDLNREAFAFVVHVGDIGTTAQACRDDWMLARQKQFRRIRAPFVLLPGDNEWSDCHAIGADPAERLRRWRSMFCFRETLAVERQPGPFCEHVRWRAGDTLFVALNVPGNNNNARQPDELEARMRAVLAWIDEAERLAPARLVLLAQANPFVPRSGYASFVERLEQLGRRMPGRVVLVHGDTHLYRNDEPRTGLRRVEVWGSPWVSWVRGALGADGLAFEAAGQY